MDARTLVITDDEELLDDLLRVAAAAGVEVVHARDAASRMTWRAASMVLLDAKMVRAAVVAGLPRRPGVIVVAAAEPDAGVWEHCVLLGVERTVLLPDGEETLVSALAEGAHTGPGGGRVVALMGARGGAGASVLAAAIAVAGLQTGTGVVLADCDRWGAGLDLLMGLEAETGLRWADLSAPAGRVPAEALHRALPTVTSGRGSAGPGRHPGAMGPGVLSVLSYDREGGAEVGVSADVLDVVLDSCRRAGELAVLDLPRNPEPAADRAVATADLVVLVVPADVPSCYAARRVTDRLTDGGAQLALVVRGPSPGGLSAEDIADALELPLLAQMRPQPHLARDLELGRPPGLDGRGPLGKAARSVLVALAAMPGNRPR